MPTSLRMIYTIFKIPHTFRWNVHKRHSEQYLFSLSLHCRCGFIKPSMHGCFANHYCIFGSLANQTIYIQHGQISNCCIRIKLSWYFNNNHKRIKQSIFCYFMKLIRAQFEQMTLPSLSSSQRTAPVHSASGSHSRSQPYSHFQWLQNQYLDRWKLIHHHIQHQMTVTLIFYCVQ